MRQAAQDQTRAEVMKLARLLGRQPTEFAYLERVAAADVRRLRDGVTELLYDADAGVLGRMAAAGRVLPTSLVASLAQRAFGPLLSARIAGRLDLDRAVDVAGKLPPDFLADVAGELDPRRATELIANLAPELIGDVSRELVRREDYVTMGRFVAHLSPDALAAALHQIDDAALLQVALVTEDSERLDGLEATLSDPHLQARIAQLRAHGV